MNHDRAKSTLASGTPKTYGFEEKAPVPGKSINRLGIVRPFLGICPEINCNSPLNQLK
jgi:hypothetical protein